MASRGESPYKGTLSFKGYPLHRTPVGVSRRGPWAAAILLVTLAGAALAAGAPTPDTLVVRVYYDRVEDAGRLRGFDVWEFNDRNERYFLVAVEPDRLPELEALGLRVVPDEIRTEELYPARETFEGQGGIPGFPCYRTVEETFGTALDMVAARPDIATWTDIGDSWEKIEAGGGYDMRVLRLTNSTVPGPKPKLIVTSAIHAREYTTAELMTRFAERLVDGYGVDPDATWILDHHEVHLILHTNPDGRKKAEAGLSWRKNTNQDYCSPTSNNRGADLNRNFDFEWGCCAGSSSNECAADFRGPFASSEPEVQVVQAYLEAQFPDQRGPGLGDPAPADATGVYLDIHSFGGLVLWPWGFASGGAAPNGAALTTLGRKLAFFNGHTPQQSIELYPTDGTTIDFTYGEMGVASFAFELGTSFFQSCSTFENTILPTNLESLFYAAKVARTPYLTPGGPDTVGLQLAPVVASPGEAVRLDATLTGSRYNQSNGIELPPAAAAGEYYVDVPPWMPGAVAIPLSPIDGSFGAKVEEAFAQLDTSGLDGGRHIVFVRGRDLDGTWGAVSAAFLWILDGTEGIVTGTVTDARTGFPLAGSVSVVSLGVEVLADADGSYAVAVPDGRWTIEASASGYQRQQASDVDVSSGNVVERDFALQPHVLLVDDDDNSPNVRAYYTDALDALGVGHDVWDTEVGTAEPDGAVLDRYQAVVWFTGDAIASAGPSPAAESALASWLDSGRCLLVTSQGYHAARGLTPFMQSRLGVASVIPDVAYSFVTGVGDPFGSVGSFSLAPPYPNATDAVLAGAAAAPAFVSPAGDAGVSRTGGFDRTSYLGFGVDALLFVTERAEALDAFLGWCFALPLDDGDADGTANGLDCAAADPSVWSRPSPARDVTVERDGPGVSWSAPTNPGADAVAYDLLRGGSPDFGTATCVASDESGTSASDATVPPPGQTWFYLVRVRNSCGQTLGAASNGSPRTAAACP